MGAIYDSTWGRLFAALYNRVLDGTERDGLGEMRGELLAGASGRTIEIGAGTGVNLEHYPDTVSELALVEPGPHMAKQLREKLAESGRAATIATAGAEELPFAADSFDTAVSTLVLCTVPDPEASLAELARVLKPGGRLLFIEHVRSEDPGRARWQDRLERPWRFVADGCHCNRDTLSTIGRSRFDQVEAERDRLPKAPPIVTPLIRGRAVVGA